MISEYTMMYIFINILSFSFILQGVHNQRVDDIWELEEDEYLFNKIFPGDCPKDINTRPISNKFYSSEYISILSHPVMRISEFINGTLVVHESEECSKSRSGGLSIFERNGKHGLVIFNTEDDNPEATRWYNIYKSGIIIDDYALILYQCSNILGGHIVSVNVMYDKKRLTEGGSLSLMNAVTTYNNEIFADYITLYLPVV